MILNCQLKQSTYIRSKLYASQIYFHNSQLKTARSPEITVKSYSKPKNSKIIKYLTYSLEKY